MEEVEETFVNTKAGANSDTFTCSICNRAVLVGEAITPFSDEKNLRLLHVCDLCRDTATARGWLASGSANIRRTRRLRVEVMEEDDASDVGAEIPQKHSDLNPQLAIIDKMLGEDNNRSDASPELLERISKQELELTKLRRELDPVNLAEQHRVLEQQKLEIQELRAMLAERERQIKRLQHARNSESSSMKMSSYALDAFNQSDELNRMARISRTLGAPVVNVHDEGPGIPRRVRITLSWDISWYEFVVKLDLGANKASVHETGTGGDPSSLPLERRRKNAKWRDSGIVI